MVIKVILFVSRSVCVCVLLLKSGGVLSMLPSSSFFLSFIVDGVALFGYRSFSTFFNTHTETHRAWCFLPRLYCIIFNVIIASFFFSVYPLFAYSKSTRRMLRMYDSRFNIHSLIRESFQYTRLRFTCVDVTVSMCACVSARVCVYKKQPNHWQHTVKCRWIEASKKYAYTIFKG